MDNPVKIVPTKEQQDIVSAATDTTDNILISAHAGASKSFTLELIAHALPDVNMLCLAFNKKIAMELQERLPRNCTAQTLNSLGHRAWAAAIGKRLNLYPGKVFAIVKDLADNNCTDQEKTEVWKGLSFILSSINLGKAAGWVPDAIAKEHPKCVPLVDDDELLSMLEEIPSDTEWAIIRHASIRSIEQALEGTIDYNDQLLMPTVFRAPFPIYSLILVDEAQDLSELNHVMLQKIYRRRIIAVGDACQAIYAFRGAHEQGMEQLKRRFDMIEYPLSCSFRCPEAIVNHVLWRAPMMTSWEGNPTKGKVGFLAEWNPADIPAGSAILCRNNAPLFRVALQLLAAGRYPHLWGNDISDGLLKTMKSLGSENMLQEDALLELEDYEIRQAKKVKAKGKLRDKVACIRILLEAKPTLGEAISYLQNLAAMTGNIDLSTGHKAKGSEWKNVYFLDEELVKHEGQDRNLRYVICTRSKDQLTYINSILPVQQQEDD